MQFPKTHNLYKYCPKSFVVPKNSPREFQQQQLAPKLLILVPPQARSQSHRPSFHAPKVNIENFNFGEKSKLSKTYNCRISCQICLEHIVFFRLRSLLCDLSTLLIISFVLKKISHSWRYTKFSPRYSHGIGSPCQSESHSPFQCPRNPNFQLENYSIIRVVIKSYLSHLCNFSWLAFKRLHGF